MIFLQNTQVNTNFKSREKNQECHPSQGEVHLVANMLLLFSQLCNQYIQLHTNNFQLESLPHLHTLQTMNQDKNSTTSLLSSTPIRIECPTCLRKETPHLCSMFYLEYGCESLSPRLHFEINACTLPKGAFCLQRTE